MLQLSCCLQSTGLSRIKSEFLLRAAIFYMVITALNLTVPFIIAPENVSGGSKARVPRKTY